MIRKLGAESKGQISEDYSFVNRIIELWNQLAVDALGTLSCKPCNFRKRFRKVTYEAK
jgi:hypothetical protein